MVPLTTVKSFPSIFGGETHYVPIHEIHKVDPYAIGSRVRTTPGSPGLESSGLPTGTLGTIVGWGRSVEAHEQSEVLRSRGLTDDANERLIDEEGPVIHFDNGIDDWFPGQSIVAIELVPLTG